MHNKCQVDHLTGKEKETNSADLYYVMWEWKSNGHFSHKSQILFYGDLKQSQPGQIKVSLYSKATVKGLQA